MPKDGGPSQTSSIMPNEAHASEFLSSGSHHYQKHWEEEVESTKARPRIGRRMTVALALAMGSCHEARQGDTVVALT